MSASRIRTPTPPRRPAAAGRTPAAPRPRCRAARPFSRRPRRRARPAPCGSGARDRHCARIPAPAARAAAARRCRAGRLFCCCRQTRRRSARAARGPRSAQDRRGRRFAADPRRWSCSARACRSGRQSSASRILPPRHGLGIVIVRQAKPNPRTSASVSAGEKSRSSCSRTHERSSTRLLYHGRRSVPGSPFARA